MRIFFIFVKAIFSFSERDKKAAFTLAEVLVTLGVIGVVSAMILPTVFNNIQERVTVSKVKKIYSTMSQAFMLSVKDNGYANEWNVGNNSNATTAVQLAGYFKPYLKIIKDCGTNSGCLGYTENVNYLNDKKYVVNYDTLDIFYKMILSDGSYIWIRATIGNYCQKNYTAYSSKYCGEIFFDINGGKQPNTIGKDIFVIGITPFAIKPNNDDNCNKSGEGWGCSGYILKNDNMDYLH